MTFLILCATAKTSSRLAELFRANHPVLLASRSGRSKHDLPTVRFDWDVSDKWNDLFTHEQAQSSPITAVYIVMKPFTVDPSVKGIPFIDFCVERGVKRFVYLSGSALDHGSMHPGGLQHHMKMLSDTKDIGWTVLRPSWFMENFSEEEHLLTITQSDCFYTAAGEGELPLVSCDDIARVAYHCLVTPKPYNGDYLICGPQNLSYDGYAHTLSTVVGRHIRHLRVTPEQLMAELLRSNMPRDYARLLVDLDQHVAGGKEAYVSETVEQMTGRKPTSFRDFCEAHKQLWVKKV